MPVSATVVRDALMTASVALLDMAADSRRSTKYRSPSLRGAVPSTEIHRAAHDRRHRSGGTSPPLPSQQSHWLWPLRRALVLQISILMESSGQRINWTGYRAHRTVEDAKVTHGIGVQTTVPPDHLNGSEEITRFQQMHREGVAERMRRHRFGKP